MSLKAIILNLDLEIDGEPEWWKDPTLLGRIVTSLRQRGLWFDFEYVGKHGASLDRFVSIDDVLTASTTWDERAYVLHTHGEGGLGRAFEGSYVSFSMRAGHCRVQVNVAPPALEAHRATLLDGLAGFVCDVHDALGHQGRIGPQAVVEQLTVPYPRMRPERYAEHPFSLGYVLEAFDIDYFERNPRQPKDQVAKILSAPTPPGCARIDHRGLVVFRWARDLADDAEVARGCARQERFMVDVLAPRILPNFNDAGDMRPVGWRARLDPHPPLTVYEEKEQTGYKAILAEEDGRVDSRDWEQIAAWAKAGQLPDGTVLKAMRVIVPHRAAALALDARAKADGIDAVLYPDPQGVWWNPRPPGWWVDD